MLKQALTGLGKAIVIVLGVGYGVVRALDVLALGSSLDDSVPNPPLPASESSPPAAERRRPSPEVHEAITQRIDALEERLARLEKSFQTHLASLEQAASPTSMHNAVHASEHLITRAELSAAMEQFAGKLDTDIQRRFDIQNRSVQSLRTMVARTDELLEQVLETIESAGIPA